MPNYDQLTKEEMIEMCKTLWLKNADLEKNIELYKEQLLKNKQKLYGKSSEKSTHILQEELDLFDEADALACEDEQDEAVNIAEHKRRKKKKYTMDNLPKNIEKEYRDYDIEDKSCPTCGKELHRIRVDEKLELIMVPATTKLIIHRIPIYACRNCQKKDKGTIIKAEGPKLLFPKSAASPSLVAHLMDMKYNKGVPIYRMEQSLKQEGILFPRHTYARWMIDVSDRYFSYVYDYMHRKLLQEDIINADETTHSIFTDGRKDSELKRTYIWMFRTGITASNAIVLYVHKGGRGGKIAENFLEGYHNFLQSDDYAGYNGVKAKRVLCHAHVRRKFADIIKSQKGSGSKAVAEVVIRMYKEIFKTDNDLRMANGRDYETIKKEREKQLRPQVDKLFTYLDEVIKDVMEKSELYKAIQYARSNKVELYRFFEDGRLELSNNLAERSQKIVIIGRKNSMFLGSSRGAQSSAMIYSLIQTAKENGLIPRLYVEYLMKQLAAINQYDDTAMEQLMPWSEEVQKFSKSENV